MAKMTLIAPNLETPPPDAREATGSGRLPDSLVSEQLHRLTVSAAVGAGLWTYGLVMDTIVRPLTVETVVMRPNVIIEVLAILTSALMFLYVRSSQQDPRTKADMGLAYFVLNAIGVALLNTWTRTLSASAPGYLSWNTVVILVAAMIMPATPRKMLATALVAATMDPLAVWLAHLRGLPVPSVVDTFVLFMPNYACAAVATVPSRVLHRLGRRLRHAQEMGSYQLIELLGRGGMGEVWRARHRLLARTAAIKLVRPELLGASSPADVRSMVRRFEQEARATAALNSPHTIRLFDFGVTDHHVFYYVMELLDGRDLESLVREFGPIPADRAVFLLRQICHSLADAHARGLVHRDLTPSNIYVCRMGLDYDFVKVLDFGLVKFNDKSSSSDAMTTAAYTTAGTPAYMAPEVILSGAVDHRADVYSLGCVAYYLLTGERVFEGSTPMQQFVQHLETAPVPPSQRTELPVPPELERLVLACLEKDPDKRPHDVVEIQRLLETYRSGDGWNNDTAKTWWERHLVELTGPLTAADAPAAEFALALR
jgi:eukaryotic-like serine/threonine-protein kinase